MNLDDLDYFKTLDSLNMLGEIDNLPDQLAFAYELGLNTISRRGRASGRW